MCINSQWEKGKLGNTLNGSTVFVGWLKPNKRYVHRVEVKKAGDFTVSSDSQVLAELGGDVFS